MKIGRALFPFLIALAFVLDQGFAEDRWQELKSDHFIVYYKEAPLDFVHNVQESAEQYYREINDNLGFTRYEGWTYDRRAKIYIYNDQEDFSKDAHARWAHGVASVQNREIRTFPSAHGFFDSTLPHELGHIVFREFIGITEQVPLWLDEGVAMYQEKAKRWGANKLVQQAIQKGQFIPLDELTHMVLYSDTPRETVELYYAEAASITYFMITELGKFRFVNFCRKLKEGSSFENALHHAFARVKNLNDLNKLWVAYLHK